METADLAPSLVRFEPNYLGFALELKRNRPARVIARSGRPRGPTYHNTGYRPAHENYVILPCLW